LIKNVNVKRAISALIAGIGRVLSAVGREIVETIKFGGVASAAAPVGRPAQSNPAAAVAGITLLDGKSVSGHSAESGDGSGPRGA
jgi:hypothetical protein